MGLTIQSFFLSKVVIAIIKCLSVGREIEPFLQRRAIPIYMILLRVCQILLFQVVRRQRLVLDEMVNRCWALEVTSNIIDLLLA